MAKGYYSVIQFCPDRSRMETANVGVLLFCPELGFLEAVTADGNDRVRRLFKAGGYHPAAVNAAKKSLVRMVRRNASSLRTLDDLQHFIATRGNDLLLTAPRPVRVEQPHEELKQLFADLVGGRARSKDVGKVNFPELEEALRSPELESRVRFNERVTIPIIGKELKAPYAFQNGKLNLISPYRFSRDADVATNAAMRLALEGDLLATHGAVNEAAQLIVVGDFEQPQPGLQGRVRTLLTGYNVEYYARDQVSELAARVDREAH